MVLKGILWREQDNPTSQTDGNISGNIANSGSASGVTAGVQGIHQR